MYDRCVQPHVPDRYRDLTINAFAQRLASAQPVPGGGSASALAAALGASLVEMVASLSAGKPRYAEHETLYAWVRATAADLRDHFLTLADDDAAAFAAFAAAMKMPRETDQQTALRSSAMRAAARRAAEAPLACVEACLALVQAAESLAGRSNVNASSDLSVASLLGEAAARGAAANVLINVPSLGDPDLETSMVERVQALIDEIERTATETRETVGSGEQRDPAAPPQRA